MATVARTSVAYGRRGGFRGPMHGPRRPAGDALGQRRSGGVREGGVQSGFAGGRGGLEGAGVTGGIREDDQKLQRRTGGGLQAGVAESRRGVRDSDVMVGLRGSGGFMEGALQAVAAGGRGGSREAGVVWGLREVGRDPQREVGMGVGRGGGSHGGTLRGLGSGAVISNRGRVSAAKRPMQVVGGSDGDRLGQEARIGGARKVRGQAAARVMVADRRGDRRNGGAAVHHMKGSLDGLGSRRDMGKAGSYGGGYGEAGDGIGGECRGVLTHNHGANGRLVGGFRSVGAGRGVSTGGGGQGDARRVNFGERTVRREGNQLVIDRVTDWAEVGSLPTSDKELEGMEEEVEDMYLDGAFDDDDLLGEEEGEVVTHRQSVRRRLVVDEDEVDVTVDEVTRGGV